MYDNPPKTYRHEGDVRAEQERRRQYAETLPEHAWDTKREALIASGLVDERRATAAQAFAAGSVIEIKSMDDLVMWSVKANEFGGGVHNARMAEQNNYNAAREYSE